MKILLTGGAGFIGSNLARRLVERDDDVIIIDNFDDFYDPKEKRKNLQDLLEFPNFFLEEGDIEDTNFINEIFKKYKLDKIIHLAARAGVRPSVNNPKSYFQTNVLGTLNLLEAAKSHKVKNFIFGSSSTVYGNSNKLPFFESDQNLSPISPYGTSKLAAEKLCFAYHKLYGIKFTILRFFSVYGPGQRPDLAIRIFIDKILKEQKIEVFGKGNFERDFTYIDDIVEGVTKAIDKNFEFEIINLGNASPVSVLGLIRKIEKFTNLKANLVFKKINPADSHKTFANIKKAKRLLGYNSKTNLDQGLLKQIVWQKGLKGEFQFLPTDKLRSILVTGGAGFVGSHLVEKLVSLGYKVKVLDNFSTGKKENLKFVLDQIELIEGDITNLDIVDQGVKNCDAVFHLAASISVPQSVKNPSDFSSTNILGAINLLQTSLKHNVKKFIFASSCAVYGHLDKPIVDENDTPNPLSVYGVSKLSAEEYCLLYHRIYGLPTVILRFFNIFGPRQSFKSNYAAVIPNFARQIYEGKPAIIYGDGNQTRDFIYVEDAVKAFLLALTNKKAIGGIFNIGSGTSTSIKTIEAKIREIFDTKKKPIHQPERVFDIKNSCANINLSKKALNFEPSFSIDEGLEKTIKYFKAKKI